MGGADQNPQYLEGALELTVNGVPLLTSAMWDYIDELWAYIINALEGLTSKEKAHTYFPDQAIKLELKRLRAGMMKISVSSASGKLNNSTKTQESQLLRKLLHGSEKFFLEVHELDSQGRLQCGYEIERCRALQSALLAPSAEEPWQDGT